MRSACESFEPMLLFQSPKGFGEKSHHWLEFLWREIFLEISSQF